MNNQSANLATLKRLLLGTTEGFTRQQLAQRLNVDDRQARDLIAELVTLAALPVIADRANGEARYRIAQAHEWDAVNSECNEMLKRAISIHRRAKGLRAAYQVMHSTGDLFLKDIPADLEVVT